MFEDLERRRNTPELEQQKLPTLDDVLEDRASFGAYVRARPGRVAAVSGGAAALIGGLITMVASAHEESRIAHGRLVKALEAATGTIAYAKGNRIELTTPMHILQRGEPRAFQVGGIPSFVTWLNDHEIIYARQHPQGSQCTVKGEKKNYTGYAASTLVEVLDIQKSSIQTLIDPYTPTKAFIDRFGDCKKADSEMAAALAQEEKEYFDPPNSGIRVWDDTAPHGHFLATGFGSDPATGSIYVRVGELWYAIVKRGESYELESSVGVPTNSNQSWSPCGGFYLEEPNSIGSATGFDWLEIRQKGNSHPSVTLAKGAHSGAWRL